MKRALIVLLSLAVAGGLFAQVTWSGHVQSGLEVVILDGSDPTLHLYSQDPGNTYRFQVGASYTNEAGTAGASGALRNANGAFGVDNSHVWVEPIDNVLRLQVSSGGGPGGFGSLGSFGASNGVADSTGFHLKLTPALDGITFGLGATVTPSNTTFDKSTYRFGVSFGLPSVLNAAANLSYAGSTEVTNVAAGVNVPALYAASGETGLTRLAVDVTANNITDLATIGIGPVVEFRVANVLAGNLSGALQSQIIVPLNDDNDLAYDVGASVSVPFTSTVTFRLGVAYADKCALPAPDGDRGTIDYSDWDALPKGLGGTDPALFVRPSVTFNIGGATVETGWGLQALLADEVQMQHGIYARFALSF
jgi:hypothetical protein